ncbi:hypothetical protein [Fischerella sp. PCC 9605]|nr:hypothetical protein [Fischerella sp. PCC 9605]
MLFLKSVATVLKVKRSHYVLVGSLERKAIMVGDRLSSRHHSWSLHRENR